MMRLEQLATIFVPGTDRGQRCLEIGFSLPGGSFENCWMGKMYDPKQQADICWYGLMPDGSNAYAYLCFDDMAAAPVFDGKSLREMWPWIDIWSIDGCAPEERLEELLNM